MKSFLVLKEAYGFRKEKGKVCIYGDGKCRNQLISTFIVKIVAVSKQNGGLRRQNLPKYSEMKVYSRFFGRNKPKKQMKVKSIDQSSLLYL